MPKLDEPEKHHVSHWLATRRMLSAHHLPDSLQIGARTFPWLGLLVGGQAAIAAVCAIVIISFSPWFGMAGYIVLGTMVALFGRFSVGGKRFATLLQCTLLQAFGVVAMSITGYLFPIDVQLLVLALLCGTFFAATLWGNFGPPGALIFVFAAGACVGHIDAWSLVLERGLSVGAGAVIAIALCLATDGLSRKALWLLPQVPEISRPAGRSLMIAASRTALAAMAASFATYWLGAAHPAWAALGVVAVMQGMHLHMTMHRAMQRTVGTLIGAAIVWAVLHTEPSFWSVVSLLAAAQIAAEILIGLNYALTQIFVTVMALLMTYFVSGGQSGVEIAGERIVDTAIGAVIAIVFALVFSTLEERAYIERRAQERMVPRPQA